MEREVTCIVKKDRANPWESITHIGGKNWSMTQGEVIAAIKNGDSFYVMAAGNKVKLVRAVSRYNNEYVKTEKDGEDPNNLLSLPTCKL